MTARRFNLSGFLRRRSEAGVVTIETAFALPVFLLLVMATIDISLLFARQIVLRDLMFDVALFTSTLKNASRAECVERIEGHFETKLIGAFFPPDQVVSFAVTSDPVDKIISPGITPVNIVTIDIETVPELILPLSKRLIPRSARHVTSRVRIEDPEACRS